MFTGVFLIAVFNDSQSCYREVLNDSQTCADLQNLPDFSSSAN